MKDELSSLLVEIEQMGCFEIELPEQVIGGIVFSISVEDRSITLRSLEVSLVLSGRLEARPLFTYSCVTKEKVFHGLSFGEQLVIDSLQLFIANVCAFITYAMNGKLCLPKNHPAGKLYIRCSSGWKETP